MMEASLMDGIDVLIDTYRDKLAEKGLVCHVAKRFFETDVPVRASASGMVFEHLINPWIEKKRGFRFQRNRYWLIILRVVPADACVKSHECKEYAFVLRKVERTELGEKPLTTERAEQHILRGVEKRLQALLRKADRLPIKQICKESIVDGLRYCFCTKYGYKKTVFGKDIDAVECVLMIGIGLGTVGLLGLVAFLRELVVKLV